MEHPDYLVKIEDLKVSLMSQRSSEGIEDCRQYVNALQLIANVVRDADNNGAPNTREIIERAGDIFDGAVDWAYNKGDVDFLLSYAHNDTGAPLVEDPLNRFGHSAAKEFLDIYKQFFLERGDAGGFESKSSRVKSILVTPNWKASRPLHIKSTRLSRFRDNITVSSTDATPTAHTILQARCEVSADEIPSPVNAVMAPDCSALVLLLQGGWKNRDPILNLCLLDEGASAGASTRASQREHYRTLSLEPGLATVAYQAAVDPSRKLALVADNRRVKTFFYGRAGEQVFGRSGWAPARGANVHTLNSGRYDGPLAVLPGPGGRVMRAGRGGMAFWDLDTLKTHEGGRRIGRGKISIADSWRDDDDNVVEASVGSSPSTTVQFEQGEEHFYPAVWKHHAPTGHMLVGEDARKDSGHYGCYAVDLNAGARKAKRFIGHGGSIGGISVSVGDANVFATGCSDGYARLYDIRHPLPVVTFSHSRQAEFCYAVELTHPDGIPILFTGGYASQGVKVWDIRAQAMVYELATGNNSVEALAWDTARSVLYAATECPGMDRLGFRHDYRPAKIPKWANFEPEEGDDDDMDEDDDDFDGSDMDEDFDELERCWPDDAFHSEAAFGYAYDAGHHTLLAYSFKEDPDCTVLPAYGDARDESDRMMW